MRHSVEKHNYYFSKLKEREVKNDFIGYMSDTQTSQLMLFNSL